MYIKELPTKKEEEPLTDRKRVYILLVGIIVFGGTCLISAIFEITGTMSLF